MEVFEEDVDNCSIYPDEYIECTTFSLTLGLE